MTPEIIGIIGVVALLILLAARIWIGAAMVIVGFLGIVWVRSLTQGLTIVGGIPYQQIAFYPITVLPMFVLMGFIISETGIGTTVMG